PRARSGFARLQSHTGPSTASIRAPAIRVASPPPGRPVFSLKPELGLPECFLRCGEPALSLGQLTAFRFDRLGVLLEIRFHLAELGGPCGMQLLEVGSLRGDVALERVQTFRLLREFNRVMP